MMIPVCKPQYGFNQKIKNLVLYSNPVIFEAFHLADTHEQLLNLNYLPFVNIISKDISYVKKLFKDQLFFFSFINL